LKTLVFNDTWLLIPVLKNRELQKRNIRKLQHQTTLLLMSSEFCVDLFLQVFFVIYEPDVMDLALEVQVFICFNLFP